MSSSTRRYCRPSGDPSKQPRGRQRASGSFSPRLTDSTGSTPGHKPHGKQCTNIVLVHSTSGVIITLKTDPVGRMDGAPITAEGKLRLSVRVPHDLFGADEAKNFRRSCIRIFCQNVEGTRRSNVNVAHAGVERDALLMGDTVTFHV